MILIGLGIATVDFLFKGQLDPFIPAAFFIMAPLELLFRKQQRIPSNIASLIATLILIMGLKTYIIDVKIMSADTLEPRISKNARMIVQKSFWRLESGDAVLFHKRLDSKDYVGEIVVVPNNGELFIRRGGDTERIEKTQIAGKIVRVFKPGSSE